MYVFFYALELWHLMVALSAVIITQSKCVNVYYSNNNVHTGALLYNDGFLRRHDTLPSVGFIANGRTANSFAPDHHHGIDIETSINPGGYQDQYKQSSGKRGFRVLLSIRKLRKIKRRKINRMNKDIELYRRVKERRLKNPNRLIDIRKVNFINDKCNPQLMRLPVSPLVDLNGIVPYKTVPEMTSQVPFNPAPVLLSLGYKFKPRGKSKYERFCEPYPMDEVLQVMDARSLGAISRMSGKYKITGDGTRMPTPMDSQPVPPGASVGKGYGFGLAKKPEPKRKPMPLSIFDPYKPEESHLVDTLDEVNQLRREALDYVERLVKPLMPKSKNASKGKMGSDNKSGTPKHDEIPTDGIKVPYLDDACNEGDIMRNPRYLGEYRNKYWIHPFYGNATMPGEERRLVEEHNRAHPDKPLVYEEYKVDIIYCHSNGTIVYLGENQEPYTNEADDFVLEGEDPREPRFVIQASAGFIKEEGLQIGQILPLVDSDMRRRYYDNIFFMPKSLRKLYPVHLPDGRPIE